MLKVLGNSKFEQKYSVEGRKSEHYVPFSLSFVIVIFVSFSCHFWDVGHTGKKSEHYVPFSMYLSFSFSFFVIVILVSFLGCRPKGKKIPGHQFKEAKSANLALDVRRPPGFVFQTLDSKASCGLIL